MPPLDEGSENTATQSAEQRDYALARSVNAAQPAVPGYALEELQGRGTFGEVLAVSCAFSRDGKQFLLGSMDDTVRRVDVPHGQPEDVLQAGMFLGIKLREPDFLLTGSGDGNARLWSLRDTHPISRYMPHGAALIDLALSPSADRLATATLDDKARLWSRTGEPLLPSLPHPAVAAVAFTPDGNSLMTASSTRIRFWDARLDSDESPDHLRTRLEVETGMH